MTLSINAWLLGKIDDYKFSVRDATVDFTWPKRRCGARNAISTT